LNTVPNKIPLEALDSNAELAATLGSICRGNFLGVRDSVSVAQRRLKFAAAIRLLFQAPSVKTTATATSRKNNFDIAYIGLM
jgi:hypothetical protein